MAKYLKWSDGRKDRQAIRWITKIQESLGAFPDGLIGKQTLLELYKKFADPTYPVCTKIFNVDVVYSRPDHIKIVETKNKRGLKDNEISGTFQYRNKFNGIAVSDGKLLGNASAHSWANYPDTVIYYDGENVGVKRCLTANDLPLGTVWAISGLGLHSFRPDVEGYSKFTFNGEKKDFTDVLRNTGHTAIGVNSADEIILAYIKGDALHVKDIMINKLKCKYAIMLDGGHIAAIKNEYSSHNSKQRQHNVIQY